MFCTKCGSNIPDDSAFCIACGQPVDGVPAQPVQPQQQWAPQPPAKKKSKAPLVIVIVVVVLAILGVGGFFLYNYLAKPQPVVPSQNQTQPAQDEDEPHDSEQPTISLVTGTEYGGGIFDMPGSTSTYSASSVLAPQGSNTYVPSNAFDNDMNTAWVEGAEGSGAGESLTWEAGPAEQNLVIDAIRLFPGYNKNSDVYYRNARPRTVRVIVNEGIDMGTVVLEDSFRLPQCIVFSEPVSFVRITLVIEDVYEGTTYEDCAISSFDLHLVQ